MGSLRRKPVFSMQKTASRIEVKKVNLYWKNEFLYSLNDKLMLLIKFMMIFYMKNMQKVIQNGEVLTLLPYLQKSKGYKVLESLVNDVLKG